MKAIYTPKPELYVIVEEYDDALLLEPVDGMKDQRFMVYLNDPCLIIDPTDDEVSSI